MQRVQQGRVGPVHVQDFMFMSASTAMIQRFLWSVCEGQRAHLSSTLIQVPAVEAWQTCLHVSAAVSVDVM
jgi:hypothetical protein